MISTTATNENKKVECVGVFKGHTSTGLRVVEKDDNTLVSVSGTTMKEWNIRTCECLKTIELPSLACTLILTKDKSKLLCELEDVGFELRRATDLSLISTFETHQRSVDCCELEDGSFVSVGHKMMRWDLEGKLLQTFSGQSKPKLIERVIELNNDIIMSVIFEDTMKIWRVSTGECLRTLDCCGGNVTQLVKLSRNKFFSWGRDSRLRVWNDEGDCIETIPTMKGLRNITRVGDYIVATRSSSSLFGISLWRVRYISRSCFY